jgi:hypothetical protein
MGENVMSDDDHSRLAERGRVLRRLWFQELPDAEQQKIIDREFERRYPSDREKREALDEMS